MNRLMTAIAGIAFAGAASAYDATYLYNGAQKDNPDLYNGFVESAEPVISRSSDDGLDSFIVSYDVFVMDNPDIDLGVGFSDDITSSAPGIGDRENRLRAESSMTETSYDAWARGNPDLESSF